MRSASIALLALLTLAAFLGGCGKGDKGASSREKGPAEDKQPDWERLDDWLAGVPEKDVEVVVEGCNAFAVDLFEKMKDREGNLFFSPFSLYLGLSMLLGGARGETAAEMRKALRVEVPPERLFPVLRALSHHLGTLEPDRIDLANRLWVAKDYRVLPSYKEFCARWFGADPETFERGALESARKRMDDWAGEKTRGLIPRIVPADGLTDLTAFVLANAIYFRGDWASPFDASDTKEDYFRVPTAEGWRNVLVPLMFQEGRFWVRTPPGEKHLWMRYRRTSMVVLVPEDPEAFTRAQDRFSNSPISSWTEFADMKDCRLFFPRFIMRLNVGFDSILASVGLTGLRHNPDLGGIDRERSIEFVQVVHAASVKVHERGTEAAAVTWMGGEEKGEEPESPLEIRADRPFLFFIRDDRTGLVLFVGRLWDPSRED